ncbi:hypothetical protein HanXRQr2_Chr17g0820881 [Helianthus annuus]|uniref:Uncharacterized protein n=1 Tax=Helianthus annuus TaxID=4232 RepID=A0A9K3DKP0_HELAN|nr:hypothetical protein HanXRQr2_Chr17g0820881 [Helianthus annuus]KAJ0814524.1 hypothetical protein HanPSC8_Chr17g0786701 [Helianthus annuus]
MNLFRGKMIVLKSRSITIGKCLPNTKSLEFLVSFWKQEEREDGIRKGSVILMSMETLPSMTKHYILKPSSRNTKKMMSIGNTNGGEL